MASLAFGVLSADRFACYACANCSRPAQRRRLSTVAALATLTLAWVMVHDRAEVVDLMEVDSAWVTVANGVVASHIIAAASFLAVTAVRSVKEGRQHLAAMAGLLGGGIGGVLFGVMIVGRRLIDIDNDLVILGVPYDMFLWWSFGPTCIVLALGCAVGPLRLLTHRRRQKH